MLPIQKLEQITADIAELDAAIEKIGTSGNNYACLVVGLVWGFFFTPDDYRQGATVKIIYLHVPSAMMAINAWVMMLVTSRLLKIN